MQAKVGVAKNIEARTAAVDGSDAKIKPNAGDVVYLDENVSSQDASSGVVSAIDSKDVMLDENAILDKVPADETANGDVEVLRQTLEEKADPKNLEATATVTSLDGASLNQVAFTQGGHISNVSVTYGDLGTASQSPQSGSVYQRGCRRRC